MKEKLTYLFSLMLLCIFGTSRTLAETVTAKWDWQNATPASITSKVAEGYDASGSIASDVDGISLDYLAAVSGSYVKLQYNNSGYAQFNPNTAIRVPVTSSEDVVTVVSYPGQSNYTVGGEDATGKNTFIHTATSSEVNKGHVEIIATATAYIYSITVVQNNTTDTYTTVYNLATAIATYNTEHSKNIEGFVDVLPPTTEEEAANAPNIAVDATGSGAKLGANGDWAQINANTILTLSGVPNGATLTFDLYDKTALTIGGTPYTNGQTYTATEDQDVVMTCTTGGYIKSITVVGAAFVETTGAYTNTWYFGKSNGAPEFALQNSAEYEYTVNDHYLIINTSAGKLNNASRNDQWAQCNNGTLFKVPVYAGSKLTWGKYSTGNTTGFNIEGTLYNDYYIANEEGTVNMSASGISYLSFIKIEPVTLYEISGTVTGGSIDGASICLTAANGQVYQAEITSGAFTASVPEGSYDVSLSEDVAYVVDSPSAITVTEAGSIGAITVTAATAQTVTGQITNAPAEAFTLTFTGNSHNKNVECKAGATSYEVTLDPDTYVISSNVGTLSPLSVESFKIVKDAATHNIYFPEAIPAATQQNITVDNTLATATANNYKSVSDALAAAKAGSISSPIITLTSGQTYREQVIVDMANVTLKTSGTEKAKITWYYGIGYTYYSLNASGYYDKDRAMTRNSKLAVSPARWGTTVLVGNTGSGFYAENIIFENSFNQYYTTEEVTDGVAPNGLESIAYDRTLTSGDAGYKAADAKAVTERAAAIGFENNPTGCEVYNCTFIGSQDTYYTSGTLYAKNCDIQGNTDYIFGGGKVVFDNCNLVIGGYSDQEVFAYITAQKGNSGECYIFRDCNVTSSGRTYVSANLGRDWGGASATVYYFNLKNSIGNKMSYTWSNMGGGVTAGTANLHIYDFDATVNANYSSTGSTGANINGLVSDADALNLYAGVVSFLSFTPRHIYDDAVVLSDGEGSAYNVCRIAASNNVERTVNLTRSISSGSWSTIVLPFAMTEAKLKAAFGNDVKVAELSDKSTADNLSFTSVTSTEANKPYAIKVASAFTSKTIEGVTIAQSEPVQIAGSWSFVGKYETGKVPEGSYYFKSNKLYLANGSQNVKPFRAYFTPTTAGAHAAVINVTFDDDITGINSVQQFNEAKVQGIFNLNGQRVSQPAQRGLYIVNGKKVVTE